MLLSIQSRWHERYFLVSKKWHLADDMSSMLFSICFTTLMSHEPSIISCDPSLFSHWHCSTIRGLSHCIFMRHPVHTTGCYRTQYREMTLIQSCMYSDQLRLSLKNTCFGWVSTIATIVHYKLLYKSINYRYIYHGHHGCSGCFRPKDGIVAEFQQLPVGKKAQLAQQHRPFWSLNFDDFTINNDMTKVY